MARNDFKKVINKVDRNLIRKTMYEEKSSTNLIKVIKNLYQIKRKERNTDGIYLKEIDQGVRS